MAIQVVPQTATVIRYKAILLMVSVPGRLAMLRIRCTALAVTQVHRIVQDLGPDSTIVMQAKDRPAQRAESFFPRTPGAGHRDPGFRCWFVMAQFHDGFPLECS